MVMINSILNNDLYKFTMQQAVLHNCPGAVVEYAFKCRNKVDLRPFAIEIRAAIDDYCRVRLTNDEERYLKAIRFLKPDYIQFLKILKLDPSNVVVDATGEELSIRIKGTWLYTILFEVPILAIVNEVCFNRGVDGIRFHQVMQTGKDRLVEKIKVVKRLTSSWHPSLGTNDPKGILIPFVFSDFGTRRRFSAKWQEYVVQELARELPGTFVGTSNVDLARRYGIKPIGTMAHEWLQASQAFVRLIDSQKHALDMWAREYRGDLGIALSDILGVDCFLRDFDMFFAKLFDGVRHDSGDPYEWTEKIIAHYESMNIDPRTKTAVYSDGLDIPKAIALWEKFNKRIKPSFGIGTNLTNDFEGVTPLQVVIKMTKCNGQPVAKISDSAGKTMCENQQYIDYLKSVFGIK